MKIFKNVLPYMVIVLIVVLIRSFYVTPVLVNGASMYPTLSDNQMLLLDKFRRTYNRFDIVILYIENERFIKRIIGLPGETVRYLDGVLYIDDEEVYDPYAKLTTNFDLEKDLNHRVIPTNEYLVMGDNRTNSIDSRIFGLVSSNDIQGTATISLFPFKTFGRIEKNSK